MGNELQRILKNEKKVQTTAPPGVLLILAVSLFLLGLVPMCLRIAGSSVTGTELAWVLAAFSFIAYYRAKQSRVNLELLKAIREIRERLAPGVDKPDEQPS